MPDTPQNIGLVEFTRFRFSEINVGDVFYYNQEVNTTNNPAHRKQSANKCLLIETQTEYVAEKHDQIYVKEY